MASSGSSSTLAVIPATSGETLPAEPPAASLTAPPAAVIPIVPAPPPAASVAVVDPVAAPPPIVPAAGAITPTGPFHFDNLIAIRLTPDNYLFWRAKVLPLLRSRSLLGFVDGSLPCPPQVIPTVHGPAINPEHRMWVQQDQAILSAIQGTLGDEVAGLCLFAITSMDAWMTLEHAFAQVSTSRSMALRSELADIKKLDSSATTYFNKMKVLADTLTSIGRPLSDEEFAGFVIKGLDADYDNLAEAVHNAKPAMPPHELYSRLLFTEQRVEARRSSATITAQPAAFWASRGQRPPAPSPGKAAPPPASTLGGGPNTRVVCQLCGRERHVASKCHRRFQRSFLGIGNDGKGNERQFAMADFGPPAAAPAAHIAAAPSAHIAAKGKDPRVEQGYTPSYPVDPAWYMDTGATDHMTNELNKLSTYQPNYGHGQVHTANGVGMPISHIGQASLLTSHPSRQLHLRNVLRVPSVTRNLLSVPKLTLDNHVLCEFHPFNLFVKDRATRDVLLSGRLSQGLYRLEDPSAPCVFSGVRVSPSQWHSRFGHPATPIVRHIIYRHELPLVSSNQEMSVCDACQQGKSHQLPFVSSTREVKNPLEIVFSDVWDPAQTSVVVTTIMSVLLMPIVASLGFIFLSANLMCLIYSYSFNCMLNVYSSIKLSMFSQIGGGGANIATSTLSLISLGSLIVYHARIHISRMALLSANIAI